MRDLYSRNSEQIAYVAGFFDGEGHIRIQSHSKRGSYMLSVSAVQSVPEPIVFIQSILGGTVKKRLMTYKGKIKAMFTWRVSSKMAERALIAMLPYLIVKKDEAILALEFRKTFRPQFGERSKNTPEVESSREAMMLGLQNMRHQKRAIHEQC